MQSDLNVNDVNQYGTVGGATQSHDGNGNLTGDGTWTFGYNTENQLISASKTGVSASYLYDPFGRQTQKTVGSAKTRFVYTNWQRIADYDGVSGNLVTRYVYGKGLDEPLIEVSAGGTLTYFHHDRMGSIIAKTDATGAVTNKYKYSPFGESAALSGTSFGFQGQRYDSEHGLYYMKHRYYNPTTGRFLQPDPIGLVAGFNLYTFVDNDPLNGSDPMGLLKWGLDFVNEAGLAGIGLNQVNAMNPNNRPIGLPMPYVPPAPAPSPVFIPHYTRVDGAKNPKPAGGGGGGGTPPISQPTGGSATSGGTGVTNYDWKNGGGNQIKKDPIDGTLIATPSLPDSGGGYMPHPFGGYGPTPQPPAEQSWSDWAAEQSSRLNAIIQELQRSLRNNVRNHSPAWPVFPSTPQDPKPQPNYTPPPQSPENFFPGGGWWTGFPKA